MNYIIFGAQGHALGTYRALKAVYPQILISCFLVSSRENNASTLAGLPVNELACFAHDNIDKDKMRVIIATPENVQQEIEVLLEEYGFMNHIRLTYDRWSELMMLFHTVEGRFRPLQILPVGCALPMIRVYMAKSHKDKTLTNPAPISDYIYPIQVGADNCNIEIADIKDNIGENISCKNANYCEITGLYWVWKNALKCYMGYDDNSYCGLAQYRRRLVLSEDFLLRLVDNDVDVVLPYPLVYEPNINAHHNRYIKKQDWEALLVALREIYPKYAEYFPIVLSQQYMYNYNVVLAKERVLAEYCEWLFPILERIEEISVPKGNERADRYIGYMCETLETLFFMKNADRLNIFHVGCRLFF